MWCDIEFVFLLRVYSKDIFKVFGFSWVFLGFKMFYREGREFCLVRLFKDGND